MDKQQMAAAGIIGLVVVGMIAYGIATFGSRSKTDKKQDFKAPELIQEQAQTKEDYNKKMGKELRETPRQPREAGVLLNPFESDGTKSSPSDATDANLVYSSFSGEGEKNTPETPVQEPEASIVNPMGSLTKKNGHTASHAASVPKSVKSEISQIVDTTANRTETVAPPQPTVRSKNRYGGEAASSPDGKLAKTEKTYSASVFGEQKLINGSLLKIRLLSAATLESGIVIPRNTFVSGLVSFASERVIIKITSIPFQNVLHTVNLTVYDANDGIEGIYIKGGALNDMNEQASSDVADEALSLPGINKVAIIRGVGQQVKKWTQKKTVTVLDGHKLYLK